MQPRGLFKYLVFMLLWIPATAHPLDKNYFLKDSHHADILSTQHQIEPSVNNEDGKIIEVRVTSSVAVEKGRRYFQKRKNRPHQLNSRHSTERTTRNAEESYASAHAVSASEKHSVTVLPPELIGANIEYIKQLRAKKEGKPHENNSYFHRTPSTLKYIHESTLNSALHENIEDSEINESIPRARSIALSPAINSLYSHSNKPNITRNNSTTTSVSFNVVHTIPNLPKVYSEPEKVYSEPSKVYGEQAKIYSEPEIFYSEPEMVYSEPAKIYGEPAKFYSEPSKVYGEPAKVYGEPEKVYSEPAKVYSEPSKVYSEPSKIYGEPAKVYSEPAKVYAEPAKFYSKPASLNLGRHFNEQTVPIMTTETSTILTENKKTPEETPEEHSPEQNYEVDEVVSVSLNGHTDRERPLSEEIDTKKDSKVGYVVEGQQFRKYRVEERTPDGFIVGEYGVVSNDDGSLRGVRYTADGDTNPRLIYDALVKFLHLT